jgi:hypothetical protein
VIAYDSEARTQDRLKSLAVVTDDEKHFAGLKIVNPLRTAI